MKIKLGLGRLSADKVAEICDGTLYTVACENKVVFETVCTDSREADNTSMFVAIRGEKVDGYSFIPNVVKAGCRCIIAERVPLDVKGVADQSVIVGIRPEGFILDNDGALVLDLQNLEVMGRDVSVVSKHENSQNPVVRSIINSDANIDATAKTINFSLKPHKVFIFNKETEERIHF